MEQQDANSEFESGYEGDSKPAEMPEVEAVVEEVKEAVAEVEPEKVDQYKELLTRFEQLEKRTRNAEGHIGGLNHNQKLIQETLTASKAVAEKVSEAPSQQQVKEAMSNPREWDDLKTDFPEWANATEKLLDARLPKGEAVDREALERSFEEKLTAREQAAAINALDIAFPDWKSDVNTQEFAEWKQGQPEDVQALGASDNPRDAARMLRLFERRAPIKAIEEPKKSTRQRLMEAAVAPKGNGGSPMNRTDIDEFEAGYSSR